MAICTSVHWAFNLMLAKSTPYMIENLGGYGIYFVFAACVSRLCHGSNTADGQTTIGAIWEFFCMPETKGRSLEEIEALFGGSSHASSVTQRDEAYEGEEMKGKTDHVEEVV